jgi:hypothetical protein
MEQHLPAVDKADGEPADAHSAVLQEAPELVADAGLNLHDISASISLVDASLTLATQALCSDMDIQARDSQTFAMDRISSTGAM